MSKQCARCGAKLHDRVKFCSICGQPFSTPAAVAPPKPEPEAPPDYSRTQSIGSLPKSLHPPTQAIGSPAHQAHPLAQAIDSPAQSIQPPTQAIGSRPKSAQPPAQAIGSRPKSAQPPAQAIGSPAQSVQPPTQAIGSPVQSVQPPTQAIGSRPKSAQPAETFGSRHSGPPPTQAINRLQLNQMYNTPLRSGPEHDTKSAQSGFKSFLKKSYLIPLTCLLPVAGIAFTFILGLGLMVLWLLPSRDDAQDTSDTAATPAPQAKRQPDGKAGTIKNKRGETVKISSCLIICPQQMRRPNSGGRPGDLYPFSSYLQGFEKRAQEELDKNIKCHKKDLARWKRTAEYKDLQARAALYKGRNRDKTAKAFGRRCYIQYEKNKKATLQLKIIELPQAEQNRRFADDCGFDDCGIKIGYATGKFEEKTQTFTGEGIVWDMPRGSSRAGHNEKKVKVTVSPKGAKWGDRSFDVYVDKTR